MKISTLAAIQKDDRGLGYKGELLFYIKEDMKRLKKLTLGKPIIMGRKTWESIPEHRRPLPERKNIVVTRQEKYPTPDEVLVAHSVEEAIELAQPAEEIIIFGGAEIYRQALPYTDRLYLTVIAGEKEADSFFPDYSDFKTVIEKEDHDEHDPPFTYLTLER